MSSVRTVFYRHTGVALLRSAVARVTDAPDRWPDPADAASCRSWLDQMWSEPEFADAVRQATPTLALRVKAIRDGDVVDAKQIRRAAVATARYLLRAIGRPTPFGLFAGVASVALDRTARVRWGTAHRPVVRADTQWLADIIDRLEACPELLARLDVAFNTLAARRGGRLEVPDGQNRVRVRYTRAVQAIEERTGSPVRFSLLASELAQRFEVDETAVVGMLTELVEQRFLLTNLRAPGTITDPLSRLIDQLERVDAGGLPSVTLLLDELRAISTELRLASAQATTAGRARRDELRRRMRELSHAGRTPLALDLILDCTVHLPEHVAHEVELAASVLLRLSRHPAGPPVWRSYHAAFLERYGGGALVPLLEALNPDAGLGYPADYPGSVLPMPEDVPSARDERLLALAWQAIVEGTGEIVLTDRSLFELLRDQPFDDRYIPPHVEMAGRIHAASVQALSGGEYRITMTPARSGGVLTSRFTPTTTGTGLEAVYRALPAGVQDALQVQMSFPPAYPHAENVCRVPAYLLDVLSLGEHRSAEDVAAAAPLEDLAIMATRDRLYLVSMSRRQVIEPQVFHALALDKQAPPLARFLAHLPRAFTATWTAFDWGPAADKLPYVPRVRHRRSVLAPARWRITRDDLAPGQPGEAAMRQALDHWRERWRCPATVDLRDDDRTLRLNLDEPVHLAILHAHLTRLGHAVLTEAGAEFGWLEHHAHEIVLPLVTTRSAAPSPLTGSLPVVTSGSCSQLPGEAGAVWLFAKLYAHPERHDELVAEHVPVLLAALGGDAEWWFIRYRTPHETDHLRLRLRVPELGRYGSCASAVGGWVRGLRRERLAGRLVLDTYRPEVGRYGEGAAMHAAEAVFVADSRAVASGLRHLSPSSFHPVAMAAASMVDIATAFLGLEPAMTWLASRPVQAGAGAAIDRAAADQVVRLARLGTVGDSMCPEEVAGSWVARRAALAAYREQLQADADVHSVLESLLHMHHNRAIGIDREGERASRRMARQAAIAWRARRSAAG